MSILKMIPGQRIAFTVARVEPVQGKFGPQYAFHGTTPDDADATIFLNVDAAERQLSRICLSATSVVGQTVEFARTEKNGTKYTDINRLDSHAAQAGNKASTAKQGYSSGGPIAGLDDDGYEMEAFSTPRLPSTAATVTARLDKLFGLYDVCLTHAHKVAEREFGTDVTDTAVAAMTATLFIAAKDRLSA